MARVKNPATEIVMRKLVPGADSQTMRAAEGIKTWAAKPKSKPKKKVIAGASMRKATDEMKEMISKQDWSAARPLHFVALYAHLHEQIYGVETADLGPAERMHAAGAAARILKTEFGGNGDEMADFMRECWKRERATEKKRRSGIRPNDDWRITWRYQFSGKPVTDYRLALARRKCG